MLTCCSIFLYLLAGGYLFNYFESWPVVTGIYFCYVTLSTIGFGDYVPGQNMNDPNRNTNLIIGAIYIFFGLAILAMCFDLMQEEIIAKFTWVGSKIGMVKKDEDDLDDDDDNQNDDLNEKKQDLINNSNLLQKQLENKEIANTNLSYFQSKYSTTSNDQYNNDTANNLLFQRQTNSSEK